MESNITLDYINIKAYQLHYLGVDGNHGYTDQSVIVGNTNKYNSQYTFTTGEPIPNWNYNPYATIDSGFEIPMFDVNGDGIIDETDLSLVYDWAYMGDLALDEGQLTRLRWSADGLSSVSFESGPY